MQHDVAPASSTPLERSPRRLERPNFATKSFVESRPAAAASFISSNVALKHFPSAAPAFSTSTDGESVFNDLRALIDYTNKSAELSNGKTIKGTDDYHPSYSSLPDYWQETERKENDTNKGMRMFYTNEYATSGYNREHVWPKSIAIAVLLISGSTTEILLFIYLFLH